MMTWVATQGQLIVALEVVAAGPHDPRYPWALRFLGTATKSALAAIADPRDRTRVATECRRVRRDDHRRRALAYREAGRTARETGEIMAEEDGVPDYPYDERTVRRWAAAARKAGMSSG